MSRQHHDHLAKGLLPDWLEPLGSAQASRPLLAEERAIDVVAHAYRPHPRWRRALGRLGSMAHGWTGFEVFRNPIGVSQLRACAAKHLDLERELRRRSHHRSRVRFWVITPTVSRDCRESLHLEPMVGWPAGFLHSGGWGITLAVVHDLPVESSTLFLRIFGRGRVQSRALWEVSQLPKDHPIRRRTLTRVIRFRREAERARRPTAEQKEFVMKTRDLYAEWEREVLRRGEAKGKAEGEAKGKAEGEAKGKAEGEAKGKAEGEAKGKAEGVLTVLETRGVKVPLRIRSRVRTCTNATQLDRLLRRAVVVSSASELFR